MILINKQLTLSLRLPEEATFANFFCGKNNVLLNCCKQISIGQGEQFIYVWGASGSGRSHLLQATCGEADKNKFSAMYLSLAQSQIQPELLENLEGFTLICLDDLEQVAGQREWETAIFHLFNRCQLIHSRLMIAGNVPPQKLPLQLPDLSSRLQSGMSYQTPDLEDQEKIIVLQARAQQSGLELSPEVSQYLLNHLPRNMGHLMQALKKLDHLSLVAQRKLTIPFVKQALGI